MDSELIKEGMQEWMCDNRLEIDSCISIALNNHERLYTEWFKYVDDCSGPDELSLYCLLRKYGVHTSVYNKSYVWMTLGNHIMLSDTEIFKCSGVRLIFLGQTHYGILREIKQPSPGRSLPTPPHLPLTTNPHQLKRNVIKLHVEQAPKPVLKNQSTPATKKRACTLSENHSELYGISDTAEPAVMSRSRRRSRRRTRCDIDYLTLNDGLEEDSVESPKQRKKASYLPNRRGPSAGCIAAQRVTSPENSPEAIASTSTSALKGVPSRSPNSVAKSSESIGVLPLPGIQGTPKNAWETSQPAQESSQEAPIALQTRNDLSTPDNPQQDELPDLVTVKTGKDTGTEVTLTANNITGNPESDHPKETFNVDPLSSGDELDVVDALLSLSGIRDENADPTMENELLMPIVGTNLPLDVAPVPIELGQVEVDHAIAKLAAQEEEQSITEKQPAVNAQDPNTAAPPNIDPNDNSDLSPPRGKGEF